MRSRLFLVCALMVVAAFASGCQKNSTGALTTERAKQQAEPLVAPDKAVKPAAADDRVPQAATDSVAPAAASAEQKPGAEVKATVKTAAADAKAARPATEKAKDAGVPEKLVTSKTQTPGEAQKAAKQMAGKSLLIVGDSFAVGVGATMANELKGGQIALLQRGKVSTGLNSPKFYNWELKLKEFITEQKPDALVAMVSGNDAHNGANSPSWKETYVQKVANFLKIPADKNIPIYLVGLPPMGKADYSERAKLANEALQNACSASPGCTYVDSWSLFTDADGNYADKKKLGAKTVPLRAGDGVHFTGSGYQLLAQHIIKQVGRQVELSAGQ